MDDRKSASVSAIDQSIPIPIAVAIHCCYLVQWHLFRSWCHLIRLRWPPGFTALGLDPTIVTPEDDSNHQANESQQDDHWKEEANKLFL